MSYLLSTGWLGLPWLTLIFLYALPGLCYAAYHLFKEYQNRLSGFSKDLLAALGKKKKVRDYIEDIVVFSIAILALAFGWPAFAIWAFLKSRQDAALEIERNKPDFSSSPQYLIAKVDPADAEIAGYVVDPLGCVPPLPFGHLNAGWVHFTADMTDEADEMWSFQIPKGSECGKYKIPATSDIRGYAKVRNGEILGEFITESD